MASARSVAYVLVILLKEIEPPIWRRLIVPSSISLKKLHLVLQTTMGWANYHLHQFETAEGVFGTPDPDYPDGTLNEARIRLDRFLVGPGDCIQYEYDFGDGWMHELRLEKVIAPVEGDISIECIDGARACPPEDVGGPHGYLEFLHAILDPVHAEHEPMVEWIGGAFDPEKFDAKAVNRALSPRRRGA
jgi:hypothetical protein